MIFVEEKAREVSKGKKLLMFLFNVMMDKELKSLPLVIKCSWIVYCEQRIMTESLQMLYVIV